MKWLTTKAKNPFEKKMTISIFCFLVSNSSHVLDQNGQYGVRTYDSLNLLCVKKFQTFSRLVVLPYNFPIVLIFQLDEV